jgi:hypothetical protein
MGNLRKIIADSLRDVSPVLQNYAETLPIEIAEHCGPAEIVDLIGLLNECSAEREAMEDSWDGDTIDDIWRSQLRLASLFPSLIATYALEIAEGLQSPHASTRFWIAHGFEKTPDRRVLLALQHALSKETDELNKKTLENAVNACSPRRWLSFIRGAYVLPP